jgi:hypothetical protein
LPWPLPNAKLLLFAKLLLSFALLHVAPYLLNQAECVVIQNEPVADALV